MKVRVYQAFASNNSGSYVLMGSFREVATATSVKAELERVFAAHQAWRDAANDPDGRPPPQETSPLHTWASAAGLASDPSDGADDDWPQYGPPPVVVASGAQLLVYVAYTITFPRLLGELVYRRGGRVTIELDHSHEPIVLAHEIWMESSWEPAQQEEAARRIAAFRAAVEGGALRSQARSIDDAEPRSAPVIRPGLWPGQIVLVHAPFDVAEGLRAVDALVAEHGLRTRVSLFESPVHDPDPVRAYRQLDPLFGGFDVILWRAGSDLVATQQAVRLATGLAAAPVAELVARAPIEILRDVSEPDAERARALVAATGAEVELVRPETKRARR